MNFPLSHFLIHVNILLFYSLKPNKLGFVWRWLYTSIDHVLWADILWVVFYWKIYRHLEIPETFFTVNLSGFFDINIKTWPKNVHIKYCMWFKNVCVAVVCQERTDIVISWPMSVPVSNSFSFSLSESTAQCVPLGQASHIRNLSRAYQFFLVRGLSWFKRLLQRLHHTCRPVSHVHHCIARHVNTKC